MISLSGMSEKRCYNQLGFFQNLYYTTDRKIKFGEYIQSKVIEDLKLTKELLETDDVLLVLYSIFDRIESGEWFNK